MDKRCRKTRKAIKSALITLMAEKDIAQISITDIAKLADINRKTFYAHYTNVYDVLDEIENDLVETLSKLIDEIDPSQNRFDPAPLFERLTEIINEDPEFYRYLFQASSYSSLFRKVQISLKAKLTDSLARGTDITREKLEFSVEYITTGTLALYKHWLLSDRSSPLDEISQLAVTLTFDGFNALIGDSTQAKPAKQAPRIMAGKCHP